MSIQQASRRRHRTIGVVACSLPIVLGSESAQAEDGFDGQSFRPTGPDHGMVQTSDTTGRRLLKFGSLVDVARMAFPVGSEHRQALSMVTQIQSIVSASIALSETLDISAAMPMIGSEQASGLGDLRLFSKVDLSDPTWAFGLALSGSINLPTGRDAHFTGDGKVTGEMIVIGDHDFGWGLVAANAGIRLRPDQQYAGVHITDASVFGAAAELRVAPDWGLSIFSEVRGDRWLTDFASGPTQALAGMRLTIMPGLVLTLGAGGGTSQFGLREVRGVGGLTCVPGDAYEYEETERVKWRAREDPDHDGLTTKVDDCPHDPGPVENRGCPVDRL